MRWIAGLASLAAAYCFTTAYCLAGEAPLYKPSSRAPAPIDIRSNAYGASTLAPEALRIGEFAADFTVPLSGGGNATLSQLRRGGPVVIIFYRGHW